MSTSDEIIEALSIDCVIFGCKNAELFVLLVNHRDGPTIGQWELPGSWIKYNESIDIATLRILSFQTAVENIFLEQFQAIGSLDRFPFRRVISLVYYAMVNIENFLLVAGPTVSQVYW